MDSFGYAVSYKCWATKEYLSRYSPCAKRAQRYGVVIRNSSTHWQTQSVSRNTPGWEYIASTYGRNNCSVHSVREGLSAEQSKMRSMRDRPKKEGDSRRKIPQGHVTISRSKLSGKVRNQIGRPCSTKNVARTVDTNRQ